MRLSLLCCCLCAVPIAAGVIVLCETALQPAVWMVHLFSTWTPVATWHMWVAAKK
ncbi:hypothetical protein T484DRAFT_1811329 [Baffinella frigidus]|nr:hypothetical protein T484DRAFT_1811329 [Cryptophyta sp. CCMP2293]